MSAAMPRYFQVKAVADALVDANVACHVQNLSRSGCCYWHMRPLAQGTSLIFYGF